MKTTVKKKSGSAHLLEVLREKKKPFKQESFSSLTDFASAVLKDAILSRALEPGARLTEEAIATALAVSRLPVREAIKNLSAQGVVVMRMHGKGAAVAELSEELLRQVYQVRAGLELLSIELAVDRIDASTLAELERNVKDGFEAVVNEQWEESARLGSEFHRLIALASGNNHLYEVINSYDEKLRWANAPVSLDRGEELWCEHQEIIKAIRDGDKARAVELMRSHTDHSGVSLSATGKGKDTLQMTSMRLMRCV
jgi:DNA-binding GntR family transcriptional regulator